MTTTQIPDDGAYPLADAIAAEADLIEAEMAEGSTGMIGRANRRAFAEQLAAERFGA